jgi:hypothetical protein
MIHSPQHGAWSAAPRRERLRRHSQRESLRHHVSMYDGTCCVLRIHVSLRPSARPNQPPTQACQRHSTGNANTTSDSGDHPSTSTCKTPANGHHDAIAERRAEVGARTRWHRDVDSAHPHTHKRHKAQGIAPPPPPQRTHTHTYSPPPTTTTTTTTTINWRAGGRAGQAGRHGRQAGQGRQLVSARAPHTHLMPPGA